MQKYIGFDSFETKWLNEGGATTHIIWSGVRYFSFFTDASNMGANMGAATMFFGIAAFHMRSYLCRIYYLSIAILAIYAMFLSGTRGAMIVPLAGLALYTFVSKQTKTIITSSTLLLLTYVFFALTTIGNSNATIRRMRTAFTPTEDASFNVRKENQKKLASYMKYKPFGEGLGLSGDRAGERISKRFTTSIPTDSWYVKIWVETGAVGLTLYLSMIFLSIGWGGWIIAMRLRDPELKGLLTGLLCGIFGMFINAYGNSFWGQFPTMVISFTGLTFIMVGPYLDQEIQEKKSTDSNIKHMIEQFFQIGENWIDKEEYLFQLIDAIVFLCFMVCVLYLFVFAVYSKRKSTYKYPTTMKKYRFAALFPAYGEDEVIIDSVKSFLQQDYPRELYDIIVIANQMRQETLDRLKSLSVKIIKMENPQSTKIEALKAAIRYIEEGKTKYDNVIILDADNIVKNNYIEKINDAIYAGCSAIQTHRVAKNRDSSIAVLDAVSEEINNSIFRKGHTRLGFSSALSGSGMAFEYGLFKNIIQGCNDIGEDKYMERKLLLQNIYIEYLEDVYTYDEKVRGKKDFYNQRQRWLATQFHNLLSGILQIPGALIKGNWDYCDKLFQWMMPPRVLLLGFITLIAAILSPLDIIISIKWWFLLIWLGITFSVAVPDYLVDQKFRKAIASVPILFFLMFLNTFRIGKKHTFSHTKHSPNHEDSH